MGVAGVPVLTIHALRHTAASLLLSEGATLFDVKELLGHASITMTSDTYGHMLDHRAGTVADLLGSVLDDEELRRVE